MPLVDLDTNLLKLVDSHERSVPPPRFSRLLLAAGLLVAVTGCESTVTTGGTSTAGSPRARTSFNANWRFARDDPAGAGSALAYDTIKPQLLANAASPDFVVRATPENIDVGRDVSYTQPDFDDSAWRLMNLPHDWGIEGGFDVSLDPATGRLPYFGIAWYRKTFTIPASDQDRRIFLDVDGAMSYASLWLNGQYLGGWPYGYSSFEVELTPQIRYGADNVIAIRLDNPNHSSRWYPGGGIYRNVWLVKTAAVHVGHWGVYVTTPEVATDSATVNVAVSIDNQAAGAATVMVSTELYTLDAAGSLGGSPVATTDAQAVTIDADSTRSAASVLTVAHPRLWSLGAPNLYAAVVTLTQDGRVVDRTTTNFGIRTLAFDPNGGFVLNGEPVRINGVCEHADLGPLGAVVNVRGWQRKIELLQEMGSNAIRTSHNMPAPELLDLCDQMGMLVMDESFDCWDKGKVANDYHLLWPDWHEKDLRAEVRRDRNHPSVILWSVGNEIPDQGSTGGNQLLSELIAEVREEDPTRMTVTANNLRGFSGFSPAEYVFGFNYEPAHLPSLPTYGSYHMAHPDVAIVGSETSSCISARGAYAFPVTDDKSGGGLPNHLMSSYDLYAPFWGTTPDDEFAHQEQNPFVAGEFVWTGFDYLGEPTNNAAPGSAPDTSRSSYFGIFDLDGFKKDRFYLYQAHWQPDLPMAHILPSWNWPGREGETTPVMVYTSGDEAELFLNGVSQGRRTKGPYEYRLRWDDVTYQPGELHVVAYKNGAVWAEDRVQTTGDPAKIVMTADRTAIANDGQDLAYVTVSIQDTGGLTVPTALNALHYTLSGPGEIAAVDNGDETSLAPIQGTSDGSAFNGLALVIVRAQAGQSGRILLTATADGLAGGSVTLDTLPSD
jgi:beta-galactosidase